MKDSKLKYLPVKISKDPIILQEQFDKKLHEKSLTILLIFHIFNTLNFLFTTLSMIRLNLIR